MQINYLNKNIMPSFNALYTVNKKENPDKTDDIDSLKEKYSYKRNGISSYIESSKTYFLADDFDADYEIETILNNKGIKFEITSFAKLIGSAENIKKRVVLSPEDKERGFRLVEIDRSKFDSLYEFFGFGYVGNYITGIKEPEKMDKFENYLKTGKKIYAPNVSINNEGKHPEIIFGDGRHRYAYMRDIKMNGIPVAMDEESIKIAKELGLLI